MTDVLPIFFSTVDFLISNAIQGRPLYAESSNGKFLNFRVSTFKNILTRNILVPEGQEPEYILKMYLQIFRELDLVITNDSRLTNIAWINGKNMRVITVKRKVYDALLGLKNTKKSG